MSRLAARALIRKALALGVLLLALAAHTPAALAEARPLPADLVVDGSEGEKTRLEHALPEALDAVEARLGRIDWAGLHIRLTTASQDRGSNVPDWAAAHARPALGQIVLRLDRIGSYPNGTLPQVLTHELAHVGVFRKHGGTGDELPRWFEEGVAMSIAREMGAADAWQITRGAFRRADLDPDTLDDLFEGGSGDAQAGYALAFSLVRHIEDEGGLDTTRHILERVGRGEHFESAVHEVTGSSLSTIAARWMQGTTLLYRWIPIATSTVTLWLIVTGLVFVAWSRKQKRVAEIRMRWALEDGDEELEGMEADERALDDAAEPPAAPRPAAAEGVVRVRPVLRLVRPEGAPVPSPREARPQDDLPGRPSVPELTPDDTTGPYGPH